VSQVWAKQDHKLYFCNLPPRHYIRRRKCGYLIRPTSPKSPTDSSRVSPSFESQDPFAFVEIIKLQVSEGVSWLLLFMVIFSGELTMGRANLGKTSQKLYFCNLPPRNGLLYDSVQKRCRFCPSYGIMVDVRIILQSAGDTGKVDLTMKVEEEFMELVEYQVEFKNALAHGN
ncbi:UNVERIFIED_CONTAM: hypothetical protein Sradi_5411100, partial [Sesamum radiatum]